MRVSYVKAWRVVLPGPMQWSHYYAMAAEPWLCKGSAMRLAKMVGGWYVQVTIEQVLPCDMSSAIERG